MKIKLKYWSGYILSWFRAEFVGYTVCTVRGHKPLSISDLNAMHTVSSIFAGAAGKETIPQAVREMANMCKRCGKL